MFQRLGLTFIFSTEHICYYAHSIEPGDEIAGLILVTSYRGVLALTKATYMTLVATLFIDRGNFTAFGEQVDLIQQTGPLDSAVARSMLSTTLKSIRSGLE